MYSQLAWCKCSQEKGGLDNRLTIPLVSDFDKSISKAFGVLKNDGSALKAMVLLSPSGIIFPII